MCYCVLKVQIQCYNLLEEGVTVYARLVQTHKGTYIHTHTQAQIPTHYRTVRLMLDEMCVYVCAFEFSFLVDPIPRK